MGIEGDEENGDEEENDDEENGLLNDEASDECNGSDNEEEILV